MAFHAPAHLMCKHPTRGMGDGNNGFFKIHYKGVLFYVIASDGLGWEHVSVSLTKRRAPIWEEMCYIKNLFWDKEDCVVQYHPPESVYVNNVDNCLHMWRKIGFEMPVPDSGLVGVR